MKLIKKLQKYLSKNKKRKSIEKALSCKGYTDERKLSLLFDLAQETEHIKGDILEIGTAWGRSLVNLSYASNKTIWSVDPHTGGIALIRRNEKQDSFDELVKNLEQFKITDRVKLLKMTTQEAITNNLLPQDPAFSLIWIDGLHTAEGVKIDFEFAYKTLVSQGIAVFDDYFMPEEFPGYPEMIDRLIEIYHLKLIKDPKSQLVYFSKS